MLSFLFIIARYTESVSEEFATFTIIIFIVKKLLSVLFFFNEKCFTVNHFDCRAFDYRAGRWSASSKMAAFVAKQMVGNKLNAVKGECFPRNGVSDHCSCRWRSWKFSFPQFSRAITNYSPSSFRGKIAFQPLFQSGSRADPIKGGTEKERSSIDCYCCVTGPNAITVRRLTANLLIYVARKSLISV